MALSLKRHITRCNSMDALIDSVIRELSALRDCGVSIKAKAFDREAIRSFFVDEDPTMGSRDLSSLIDCYLQCV